MLLFHNIFINVNTTLNFLTDYSCSITFTECYPVDNNNSVSSIVIVNFPWLYIEF